MKKGLVFGGIAVIIYWMMSKKITDTVSNNSDIQYSNFLEAVNFLIDKLEGTTLENVKNDAGGLTKFGIDQRSHPAEDIANLTRERAIEIYLTEYWGKGNLNLIPSNLQLQHFCGIAVMGISGHSKVLQRAANVIPDGDLGPISLAALNFVTPERVADYERARYDGIISRNPQDEVFRDGWYNRIAKTLAKQIEINVRVAGIKRLTA